MNNPPAFPRPGFDVDTRGFEGEALREKMAFISEPQSGMTLRDYFAAKAMQAYARCSNAWEKDEIARQSWIMADAMLKEREQ